VVWDTMAGDGKGGASSTTANYLASLMKSLPPLENLFNIAGLSLPDFLLKAKEAEKAAGATKFEYSPPPAPKLTPEPPAGGDEPATGK
jgi:hypothetical protein